MGALIDDWADLLRRTAPRCDERAATRPGMRPSGGRRVTEIMSWAVLTASATTTAGEARRLLSSRGVHHLPVLEGNVLAGMLCSCDLWGVPAATPLGQLMRREVATVRADARSDEAAQLMRRREIGALPVLYHGFLIGMVTAGDLVRAHVAPPGLRRTCQRCGGHHHVRGDAPEGLCLGCARRERVVLSVSCREVGP